MSRYAAVWLDHKEARIFHIHMDGVDEAVVVAALPNLHHKHPRGADGDKEHPDDVKRFFRDVGRGLDGAEEILVVGPGSAKLEFLRYVHRHDHALEPKIIGMETSDHPTDKQLAAYAKTSFGLQTRLH
ncbi:MAG: translational machinery protein [Myxococcales bacterium]|nr:translational machinery protein [Myxococcales bacterium]